MVSTEQVSVNSPAFTIAATDRFETNGSDIVAADFLKRTEEFPLPVWNKWGVPMNKQLAHLTYARVTKPKAWDGRRENKLLIEEFRHAWKLFRSKLPEPYRSEFEKQINKSSRRRRASRRSSGGLIWRNLVEVVILYGSTNGATS